MSKGTNKEQEEQFITKPVYLDVSTGGGDFLGALMPSVRLVLMPDGTVRWLHCDVPMCPKLFPSKSEVRSE